MCGVGTMVDGKWMERNMRGGGGPRNALHYTARLANMREKKEKGGHTHKISQKIAHKTASTAATSIGNRPALAHNNNDRLNCAPRRAVCASPRGGARCRASGGAMPRPGRRGGTRPPAQARRVRPAAVRTLVRACATEGDAHYAGVRAQSAAYGADADADVGRGGIRVWR
jgi:hypothetical protein